MSVVCYVASDYVVGIIIETDAIPEGRDFSIHDCHVYSAGQVYPFRRIGSCALNSVACPINYNVIPFHNNGIINVASEGVSNVSVVVIGAVKGSIEPPALM